MFQLHDNYGIDLTRIAEISFMPHFDGPTYQVRYTDGGTTELNEIDGKRVWMALGMGGLVQWPDEWAVREAQGRYGHL